MNGGVAEWLRRSATNPRGKKRPGFESCNGRNHSPQANSQLSFPSSRWSVNEYSNKIRGN